MGSERETIDTPAKLVAWRTARGLSQVKSAPIFRRKRRSYQKIESGVLQVFPPEIDDLAHLYELTHDKKKKTRRRLD